MEQGTLFPDVEVPQQPIRERNDVEYLRLACKTILNSCNTCRMPNAVTINPYRGCEFGCTYCYARYTHEFMDLPRTDFEKKIFVKATAPDVLLRTLDSAKLRGKHVAIGSATDPYQPAESRFHLTRRLLEVFTQVRGLTISITTKSALVKRDIDLFRKISERHDFRVNISLISLNRSLLKELEPKASTPEARLGAMKAMAEAGIKTGVLMMPILPALTDSRRTIESVIRAAFAHKAAYLWPRVLFLRESAKQVYYDFLRVRSPRLYRQYASMYGGRTYTNEEYQSGVLSLVEKIKEECGFRDSRDESESYELIDQGGDLFENRTACGR